MVYFRSLAAMIVAFYTLGWPCMLKPLEYIFSKTDFELTVFIAHCSKTSSLEFQHQTLIYNCSIDVSTDALSKPS